MIVVVENHMTSSARYADILLPDKTSAERTDITRPGSAGNMAYAILGSAAIPPMYECKDIYEICTGIAEKLGIRDKFTENKTPEDWIRSFIETGRKKHPDLPSFEEWKKMGIFRKRLAPVVAYQKFRDDPVANKLKTPSGKIEIYSQKLAEIGRTWELPKGDKITALPEHLATWESYEDTEGRKQHPLQCIGHHYKQRTHSSYGNCEWLAEAHPQHVWINPLDAERRGIGDGDRVVVFNDRGKLALPAFVTPRIVPGVLSVPQGAWFKPDASGVDQGGSVNTLTSWHPSPLGKGNAQHTNLVEVRRA